MNALKMNLSNEKKKISDLDFGSKLEYVWQYYKLWITGFVCVIALLACALGVSSLASHMDKTELFLEYVLGLEEKYE